MQAPRDNRYQRLTDNGPAPHTLAPVQPVAVPTYRRPLYKAHSGGSALALALVGFLFCPLFAIPALFMASHDRKQIRAGVTDPSGEGLVLAAYWLALIQVVLMLLAVVFILLVAATC
jgi:hypothetical protein